mmetsp:Transcript_17016/g.53127  ORF Transcript_17016/g.53127 Transcript_17016/m.53127 type:complete len:253 (-) Transcript_17016:272-1030(-)
MGHRAVAARGRVRARGAVDQADQGVHAARGVRGVRRGVPRGVPALAVRRARRRVCRVAPAERVAQEDRGAAAALRRVSRGRCLLQEAQDLALVPVPVRPDAHHRLVRLRRPGARAAGPRPLPLQLVRRRPHRSRRRRQGLSRTPLPARRPRLLRRRQDPRRRRRHPPPQHRRLQAGLRPPRRLLRRPRALARHRVTHPRRLPPLCPLPLLLLLEVPCTQHAHHFLPIHLPSPFPGAATVKPASPLRNHPTPP